MKTPFIFWGKSSKEYPAVFHPLVCHMVDSLNVAESIWKNYLSSQVKEIISERLGISLNDADRWLPFLVSLHDIGKACPGFQNKNPFQEKRIRNEGFDFHSALSDHRLLTAYLVKEMFSSQNDGIPKLDRRTKATIYNSLGGHHGSFVDPTALMNVSPRDVGDKLWSEERRNILQTLIEISGITDCNVPMIPEKSEATIMVFLSGLTSVADWISSSVEFFPYYESNGETIDKYHSISKERARSAIDHLNWTASDNLIDRTFLEAFKEITKPFPLQQMVSELSDELSRSGLVIIEAPMGEGKTEAAFYLMERMNRVSGREGAFIALPTQATSNQIFNRMVSYFNERKDEHRINLALIHGQAMLSDEYQRLIVNQSVNEELEANLIANEWFNYKKRSLLSPFGIGTIDQALLGVLPVKHFFVRLFGLSGKVVILDEVHAYDVYMSTLLDLLLKWLSVLGSKVILLSATLPSSRRRQLIESYAGEYKGNKSSYPRITWCSAEESNSVSFESASKMDKGRPDKIDIEFIDGSDEQLIPFLKEKMSEAGRVAILCNTVKTAQNKYRMIRGLLDKQEFEVELLHARYPFSNRKEKEDSVINKFGRKRFPEGGKHILIATQIIEQSLDIDFDLMISEMAPIDLLIQRSGRIHRHKNERPKGMEAPRLCIIQPEHDDRGVPDFGVSEFVYSRYVLLKSYLSIKDSTAISMPDDIERLVEEVYSDSTDGPETYRMEKEKLEWESEIEINRREAEKKIIKSPDYDLPWDATSVILKEEEPAAHRMMQALTRLTRPNVSLICLYDQGGRLSTDKAGQEKVDLEKIPDLVTAKRLLNNSISISDREVVSYFTENIEVPPAWAKSSLLRNHRAIIMRWSEGHDSFIINFDNKLIIFNEDLGFIVGKGGE